VATPTAAYTPTQLDDAIFRFGPHACTTCRQPMRKSGQKPIYVKEPLAIVGAWEHVEPTDCTSDRAAPVIGYTTQGLAVFASYALGDPHPPQRSVPPWDRHLDPTRREVEGARYARRMHPDAVDTTGTEWWLEEAGWLP